VDLKSFFGILGEGKELELVDNFGFGFDQLVDNFVFEDHFVQ